MRQQLRRKSPKTLRCLEFTSEDRQTKCCWLSSTSEENEHECKKHQWSEILHVFTWSLQQNNKMLASGRSQKTFRQTRHNNPSDVLLSTLQICTILQMWLIVQNLPEWFVLTRRRSGIHSDEDWNTPTEIPRSTPLTAFIVKLSRCQILWRNSWDIRMHQWHLFQRSLGRQSQTLPNIAQVANRATSACTVCSHLKTFWRVPWQGMKQTNRNAQYQTNNSIACKIVKLSNYQLSRIAFMDDDNADIHLLSADNGDAKNRWDPPTPLAPRQRTGRVRGHLQASPPRCRIATADNPTF